MSTRMYRAILRLYAPDFREEYGEEMVRVYADLRRDDPRIGVWLRLARDTALAAPRSRMEANMKRNTLVIAIALIVGVGVTGVITGHFFIGGLIFLGVGAALVVPSALLARRARQSADYVFTVRPWTFWTVPAIGVALLYLAFGIGQLVRTPKKEHVFALCAAIAFSAMIAGGLRLRQSGRVGGNWLVAAASLPLLSVFWAIWPTVVALVIMIGAMTEALSARSPRAA